MKHPEDREELEGIVKEFYQRVRKMAALTEDGDEKIHNTFCTGMMITNYACYLQRQCEVLSQAVDGFVEGEETKPDLISEKIQKNTERFLRDIMSSYEEDILKSGPEDE